MQTIFPDLVSRFGPIKIAQFLRSGANIDETDSLGRTALYRMCQAGSLDKVRLLLECGANPNILNKDGISPLAVACVKNHAEIVHLLVVANADVNHCPSSAMSTIYSQPILCLAINSKNWLTVDLLIEAGAKFEPLEDTITPLIAAARVGNTSLCRRFMLGGADPNRITGRKYSAIHDAIAFGNVHTVKALLSLGASPNIINCHGETPTMAAISHFGADSVPILFELIRADADLNLTGDLYKRRPIDIARDEGLKELVSILELSGADASLHPHHQEREPEDFDIVGEDGQIYKGSITIALEEHEKEDSELANEVNLFTVNSLLKNFGWQSSPAHWQMLEALQEPLPIKKIAYVARGNFNVKDGQELNDWQQFLGETYIAAIQRFISFGYVRQLAIKEKVHLKATVTQLKSLAKRLGVKNLVRRDDLIKLTDQMPAEMLEQLISLEDYYIRTPLGDEVVSSKQDEINRCSKKVRSMIFEAMLANDQRCALLICLDYYSMTGCHGRSLSPSTVYKIRLSLSAEIPERIKLEKEEDEPILRAIAATCCLNPEWNSWQPFYRITPPQDADDGTIIPPSRFTSLLVSEYEASKNDYTGYKQIDD